MTYISVTALTQESGRSTFIKHRFPAAAAVGRFGWVFFGLVLGWVVSAYLDGSFRPNTPPPPHHHNIFYISRDNVLFYEVSYQEQYY